MHIIRVPAADTLFDTNTFVDAANTTPFNCCNNTSVASSINVTSTYCLQTAPILPTREDVNNNNVVNIGDSSNNGSGSNNL